MLEADAVEVATAADEETVDETASVALTVTVTVA